MKFVNGKEIPGETKQHKTKKACDLFKKQRNSTKKEEARLAKNKGQAKTGKSKSNAAKGKLDEMSDDEPGSGLDNDIFDRASLENSMKEEMSKRSCTQLHIMSIKKYMCHTLARQSG